MLQKNNMFIGIAAGLILPGLTWAVFGYLLKNHFIIRDKPLIPYLVTLALNLFIIRYLFKKGADQTGAGMILSTFVSMLLVFLFQSYLK
jgi:hypothetical protein